MQGPTEEHFIVKWAPCLNIFIIIIRSSSSSKDAIHLRYDWDLNDIPSVCVCGDVFNIDHAMICRRGGFIIQRHNKVLKLKCYFKRTDHCYG